MSADTRIFDAARETYLSRATIDPQWRDLYRQSVDLVMATLEAAERQRLLHYINQFSVLNAVFVVQRLAEVHAPSLYPEANAELAGARRQRRRARKKASAPQMRPSGFSKRRCGGGRASPARRPPPSRK